MVEINLWYFFHLIIVKELIVEIFIVHVCVYWHIFTFLTIFYFFTSISQSVHQNDIFYIIYLFGLLIEKYI